MTQEETLVDEVADILARIQHPDPTKLPARKAWLYDSLAQGLIAYIRANPPERR